MEVWLCIHVQCIIIPVPVWRWGWFGAGWGQTQRRLLWPSHMIHCWGMAPSLWHLCSHGSHGNWYWCSSLPVFHCKCVYNNYVRGDHMGGGGGELTSWVGCHEGLVQSGSGAVVWSWPRSQCPWGWASPPLHTSLQHSPHTHWLGMATVQCNSAV